MFSPGKVENWVVLVNLGNIGYVPKIPIKVKKLFLFPPQLNLFFF